MKKAKQEKPFWRDLYEEQEGYLISSMEKLQELEGRYALLDAYIDWKGLRDECEYFQEHAHEEYDPDLPFPRLVL
jgi:hypothetical protein